MHLKYKLEEEEEELSFIQIWRDSNNRNGE